MKNNKYIPQVISRVVNKDLCTGCGLCITECDSKLAIDFNNEGFFVPKLVGDCNDSGDCIKVCPFNDKPIKQYENEDKINEQIRIGDKEHLVKNKYLGQHLGIYAGHSINNVVDSSSGGIATYVLTKLLEDNIIDYVISVKESKNKADGFYEYNVSTSVKDVVKSSKTKYYPVNLSQVLKIIENTDAKFAITGVPCFIKGIRLKQRKHPYLKNRIPFLIGIFCGGLKSKFYTDYLIGKTNFDKKDINDAKPLYRIKNENTKSSDYSFGVINIRNESLSKVRMKSLSDMWGTGLFKSNACDFCDDLCGETADLSIGDAWIEPYVSRGSGDNIIITRSQLADKYIKEGIVSKELSVDIINSDLAIKSQRGNVNHRRKGLKLRLFLSYIKFKKPLKKRVNASPFHGLSFWLVQIQRRAVRRKSLFLWPKSKDSEDFENKIEGEISLLTTLTRINHFFRKFSIKKLFKKIITSE